MVPYSMLVGISILIQGLWRLVKERTNILILYTTITRSTIILMDLNGILSKQKERFKSKIADILIGNFS